jgi:hypothetical protein
MKTFKQIDLAISSALMTGFFIAALIKQDETFIIGYFVTGGWQVISMIVHAMDGTFARKGTARYNYHWIVVIVVGIALLSVVLKFEPLLMIFFVLIFIAPIMAVYYTWLCGSELSTLRKREFIHLK